MPSHAKAFGGCYVCADTERECSGVVGANYLITLDMQLGTYSRCECKNMREIAWEMCVI